MKIQPHTSNNKYNNYLKGQFTKNAVKGAVQLLTWKPITPNLRPAKESEAENLFKPNSAKLEHLIVELFDEKVLEETQHNLTEDGHNLWQGRTKPVLGQCQQQKPG